MLGAILGDIAGSTMENTNVLGVAYKRADGPLIPLGSSFTDDTVLTVATAHVILTGAPYAATYHEFGRRYPNAGYGGGFRNWLQSNHRLPYNSFGNGSAMRVSPVGYAYDTADEVLAAACESASVTHSHTEGIKGAQAVALAVFRARHGVAKEDIRDELSDRFAYDMARTIDTIRPGYSFDVTCQGSVPEALIAFLEANSTEDAIRLAISLGGDTDTQACIAGAVAEAWHGDLSANHRLDVAQMLPQEFIDIIEAFARRYGLPD
jgi:ADP-ribosylglycohydrolase